MAAMVSNPYRAAIATRRAASQNDLTELANILRAAVSAIETAWIGSPLADQTQQDIEILARDARTVSDGMEAVFTDAIKAQDRFVEPTAWQVRWSRAVF